jgi:hypothetical protein
VIRQLVGSMPQPTDQIDYGVKLHLIAPRTAVISFVVTVLLSAPIFYFVMYHTALTRISSRRAANLGSPRPE